jgi:hypothetical protein
MMVATTQDLVNQNPGVFQNADLLINSTSIDSLSPESPVFQAMLRSPRPAWVKYHNIVGLTPKRSWFFGAEETTGDGVVEFASARTYDSESEISVPAEHQVIHRHPKAILEVRRVLVEHLRDYQSHSRIANRMAGSVSPSSAPRISSTSGGTPRMGGYPRNSTLAHPTNSNQPFGTDGASLPPVIQPGQTLAPVKNGVPGVILR